MTATIRGVKFHRRTMLAGLSAAGAALFASVVRRSVAQEQGGDPNVIFFFTPNGSLRDEFGADGTATDFTLRSSLAALEPFKSRIHVIHDINNMGYPNRDVSHSNITRILTCVNGTDPNVAAGPSVDHVLAGHLGQTPLVLGVQPVSGSVTYHDKVSWAAAGVPTTPTLDSVGTFERLFPSSEADSEDPDRDRRWNARTKSILDHVRGDLSTLRGRLGPTGRDLLDIHTTSLRELEQSLMRADLTELLCDLENLRVSVAEPLPPSPGVSRKSYLWTPVLTAHGRLQMDIIAMALACGRRRVATLVWQPCAMEGVNPGGTVNDVGHHDVSHWSVSDFNDQHISREEAREQYLKCDRYYAEQYAYLLNKLDQLGILGDTFVPWITDTRDAAHQQGRFHIVVAGGENHGIKTGRFTQYAYSGGNDPKKVLTNRSFADLWVSTHKMMGIEPERVGDKEVFGPPEYCHGAGLEEVY